MALKWDQGGGLREARHFRAHSWPVQRKVRHARLSTAHSSGGISYKSGQRPQRLAFPYRWNCQGNQDKEGGTMLPGGCFLGHCRPPQVFRGLFFSILENEEPGDPGSHPNHCMTSSRMATLHLRFLIFKTGLKELMRLSH